MTAGITNAVVRWRPFLFAALVVLLLTAPAAAQIGSPPHTVGREAVEALRFPLLDFEQPTVDHHEVEGVAVLLLEDRSLPMVTVHAYFRGGYGLFGREVYAAAMGLPAMLRYGGTRARTPATIDEEIEQLALQLSFGTSGGSITTSMNTLTEHLDEALDLWREMLAEPAFEVGEIEGWRGRQLDGVLRRLDDPARLAYSELNHLLYGDHPVGWEMGPDDLTADRVDAEAFLRVHDRVVCRDNLILGVTGDAAWVEIRDRLDRFIAALPECPAEIPKGPAPDILRAPGVFLIEKEIEQAVIVMAHPTSVHFADDPRYFAAMIGNSILGGGGFSSRIMGRVRTDEGFAYSAASLWTTPREQDGLIGATTRTRPDAAVPAIELILETMEELRERAPTQEEVATTVDQMVNGFVFNFDSPGQIVARTMYYMAQELPEDWLERYLRGVQLVTPEDVRRVFAEHLRPEEMTILIVGDPARLGRERLAELGPLTVLPIR